MSKQAEEDYKALELYLKQAEVRNSYVMEVMNSYVMEVDCIGELFSLGGRQVDRNTQDSIMSATKIDFKMRIPLQK